MNKPILLKFKSSCYLFLFGILNLFAFSFLLGCSNNPNQKKENHADSMTRVKRINDSLIKEHKKLDSLAKIKGIKDTFACVDFDTIKKKQYFKKKQIHQGNKYGILPANYRKNL
jgi:hypothetical protein